MLFSTFALHPICLKGNETSKQCKYGCCSATSKSPCHSHLLVRVDKKSIVRQADYTRNYLPLTQVLPLHQTWPGPYKRQEFWHIWQLVEDSMFWPHFPAFLLRHLNCYTTTKHPTNRLWCSGNVNLTQTTTLCSVAAVLAHASFLLNIISIISISTRVISSLIFSLFIILSPRVMEAYMSVLFNMKSTSRHSRGPLVFGRKESTRLANISLVDVNVDDESVVRRVIQQISMGDFAHLPPMSVLKKLLQSERHSAILQKVYRHLSLTNLSIDGTTARVLSIILLSPQCCCRYVHIHRCSFTEQGRNILFSALSVMAATLGPHRHTQLPASGFVGSSSSERNLTCKTRIAENGYANALESVSSVAVAEEKCHMSAGLVELNYTQIGVSDRNYYTLTDVLLQQSYLHTLNLSNNAMVPKSAERLVEAISSGCPSLRVLDLSGNLLRTDGARIIARYLIAKGRNLELLNVSGNQIPPGGGVALANSLRARFGSKLKVLNVGMNQLEIAGSEALGHALAENKHLEQLAISQNNILDNGCELLFDGLRSNNTLLSIDISGNFLTHISARNVSSYMTSRSSARNTRLGFDSTGIRTLNMSANPLGNEGIAALCSGLQNSSHLVHLYLDNVEVADLGVESVRQLLQTTAKNKISLLTLSLRQNRHITHVGIRALADGCLQNSSVLRVTVDMCFDRWSTVWDKAECAFIINTMRAIDRYKVPLLMVARGRILLCQYKRQRIGSSTQRLPEEICLSILSALDKHGVLTAKQKCMAFKIAQRMSNKYPSKRALLSAILGSDYRFVSEIMKTLHSS